MTPEINKVHNIDCLEGVRSLADKSVNCVITSPPYWQLRDYGWNGQWGLEPTFRLYLENLWSLMDEIYRVLTDDGTVWVNLGDTYNNPKEGNTNGTYGQVRQKDGVNIQSISKKKQDVPAKCLLLIPHRFAIGCIDRGWIIRNDIIWGKRNGMPESVTDRFSKKHEYIFFMSKSEKYYFDLDGIREKSTTKNRLRNKSSESYSDAFISAIGKGSRPEQHPLGKNPGTVSDFWDITTKPSSKEHYATFNDALISKPIIAGCPEGGVILDPFAGTATTLIRAHQLGRNAIGFEGNSNYCDMANKYFDLQKSQLTLFAKSA